jgi:hypothetical protein
MTAWVFDLETDGLLKDLTKIHCAVFTNLDNGLTLRFYDDLPHPNPFDVALKDLPHHIVTLIEQGDTLIGHNIISFDCRVLKRFYGMDLGRLCLQRKVKLIDTLVMSGCLNPDRQLPNGCPTSIEDPETGRLHKIGPHSLEAWGYRLGNFKIHHHDWMTFSPEMLERCTQDVRLNVDVYYALLKEAGLAHGDL